MQLIDISTIKTTNQYLRLDTNVEMLKKSIETVGLINPIVLNQNKELIAGGRRFTAMKELGFTEVPTITVDKSELEQELISIDENLVRKDLTNIELEASLARGRELYETLYPDATKFNEEDLTLPESNEIHTDLANDKRSFIDLTAEKTGLSKKVIKSAIDRDEKASDKVKELRSYGELNATQTNEIIKLSKEEQEHVAELVKDKSAKEVKELVRNVTQNGLQSAVNELVNSPQLPKEYKSLKTLLQRTNKTLAKVLIEEMTSEHEEVNAILDQMSTLRLSLDQFLVLCTGNNKSEDTNYDYEEVVDEAMTALSSDHADKTMDSDSAEI
jgi:ParB family chromosome partitioning protein